MLELDWWSKMDSFLMPKLENNRMVGTYLGWLTCSLYQLFSLEKTMFSKSVGKMLHFRFFTLEKFWKWTELQVIEAEALYFWKTAIFSKTRYFVEKETSGLVLYVPLKPKNSTFVQKIYNLFLSLGFQTSLTDSILLITH